MSRRLPGTPARALPCSGVLSQGADRRRWRRSATEHGPPDAPQGAVRIAGARGASQRACCTGFFQHSGGGDSPTLVCRSPSPSPPRCLLRFFVYALARRSSVPTAWLYLVWGPAAKHAKTEHHGGNASCFGWPLDDLRTDVSLLLSLCCILCAVFCTFTHYTHLL